MPQVARLFRSIRHLRVSQLVWRTHYQVKRRLPLSQFWSADAVHWSRIASASRSESQSLGKTVNSAKSSNDRRESGELHSAAIATPQDLNVPCVPVFHSTSTADQLINNEFRHLNQTVMIDREHPDWQLADESKNRLWKVTLHYHAWAYELAVAAAAGNADAHHALRAYLTNWLDNCSLQQLGCRNLVWNAFAVATRISWWVRMLTVYGMELRNRDAKLHHRIECSLALHAEFLARNIEWDLRANHVLRDAVGLAWAGRYFGGSLVAADASSLPASLRNSLSASVENSLSASAKNSLPASAKNSLSARWQRLAEKIALSQISEQVLADGGHFERSPMYHIHVMEDVLSLALLLPTPASRKRMRVAWNSMAEFLRWARQPNGEIPLFNDAAQQAVCQANRMLALGETIDSSIPQSLPMGGKHFAQTGLVVWHGNPWTVFFDVGPVGPSYQPGHAHADSLAIECSFHGKALFVDPGTFGYDRDARREYDRSTAAHNTVCVDGVNSSEVWHIFRVGDRAMPSNVIVEMGTGQPHAPEIPRIESNRHASSHLSTAENSADDNNANNPPIDWMTATAAHNGYRKLPGSPRHQRRIVVANASAGAKLEIADVITGSGQHTIETGYLVAPGWEIVERGETINLLQNDLAVRMTFKCDQPFEISVEDRPWHPEYGEEISARRITFRAKCQLPFGMNIRLEPATTVNPPHLKTHTGVSTCTSSF